MTERDDQVEPSCTGKQRYVSPALAHQVAQKSASSRRRRHKARQAPTHVYRCEICGGWHIGRNRGFGGER